MDFKSFPIFPRHAIHHLQAVLAEISKPPIDSNIKCFQLCLYDMDFTPTILALVVQILHHPLPRAVPPTGKELYWDSVYVRNCKFSQEVTTTTDLCVNEQEGFGSKDHRIHIFISALAHCPRSLFLYESPEILECFFHTTSHLEWTVKKFFFTQDRVSAISPCASRMGSSLSQERPTTTTTSRSSTSSVSLNLHIAVGSFEEPLVFGKILANTYHLRSVRFSKRRRQNLEDVLVTNDHSCIVQQLLSPPSRLEKLHLSGMKLDDHRIEQIAELLPTSTLKVLNVSDNYIGSKGILALACQLPRIKSLKKLDLSDNLWENYNDSSERQARYSECIAALVRGMLENDSLEHFYMQNQSLHLKYLTYCNRIRRRVLPRGLSIKVGLWPWILQQVGSPPWDPLWGEEEKFRTYRATALYFVLQNCPILSSVSLMRNQWVSESVY